MIEINAAGICSLSMNVPSFIVTVCNRVFPVVVDAVVVSLVFYILCTKQAGNGGKEKVKRKTSWRRGKCIVFGGKMGCCDLHASIADIHSSHLQLCTPE